MTEVDRRTVHTFTTDAGGVFRFPNLPVGAYVLEVSSPGFKAYRQTGITLQVASNVEQNVVMGPGRPGSVDKGSLESRGERLMVSTAGKVTSTQFEWKLRF